MTNLKHIRSLVVKWKLNRTFLARKIGMPATTFSYIIKGKDHYHITPEQLEKLTTILSQMLKDLTKIQNGK